MLLSWVLARDIESVRSMIAEYGGWQVDGETAARIQPSTWDDVRRVYAIDGSLPKDEQVAEAFRRGEQFVIPAGQAIFAALLSGEIVAWARPNGSGDVAEIEPVQWTSLRFRSLDGHDMAVPVDSEGEPLILLRPLAHYLSGEVPESLTPTVWPDPLFPSNQAMTLWPAELTARPQESNATETPTTSQSGRRHGPTPTATIIKAAAERLLVRNRVPAKTVKWQQFQTELCAEIGVKAGDRGYSLDTIQAAVRPLLSPHRNRGNTDSNGN